MKGHLNYLEAVLRNLIALFLIAGCGTLRVASLNAHEMPSVTTSGTPQAGAVLWAGAWLDGRCSFNVPGSDGLGAGAGAELELRSLFGSEAFCALAIDYGAFLPEDDWVESLIFGSVLADAGYRFQIVPQMSLAPHAGMGVSIGRLSSAGTPEEAMAGIYSVSTGTQLIVQAGLGLEWQLGDWMELSLRPAYRLLAEAENTYQTATLGLGARFKVARLRRKSSSKDEIESGSVEPMPDAETALDRLSREPNIQVIRGGKRIRIVIEGSFSKNEAILEDRTARQLDLVGAVIRDLEPGRILIEGYVAADAQIETDGDVSLARAAVAREWLLSSVYLIGRDVPVEAMGRGRENPVGDNESEEGRIKNRRIEILLETN